MEFLITIIVIGIFFVGFAQESDRKKQQTENDYNSAKARGLISYWDYKHKCQRDMIYHYRVEQYLEYDKKGNPYHYIVAPTIIGANGKPVLFNAKYTHSDMWDKPVNDDKLSQYETIEMYRYRKGYIK